jgi:hypothetical protein
MRGSISQWTVTTNGGEWWVLCSGWCDGCYHKQQQGKEKLLLVTGTEPRTTTNWSNLKYRPQNTTTQGCPSEFHILTDYVCFEGHRSVAGLGHHLADTTLLRKCEVLTSVTNSSNQIRIDFRTIFTRHQRSLRQCSLYKPGSLFYCILYINKVQRLIT